MTTVLVPADAGLCRLLRGPAPEGASWHVTHRHIGVIANAADPAHPTRTVDLPRTLVPVVRDDLDRMLARARADGDPAAAVLAAFMGRVFGREVPAPEAVTSGG